MGEPYFRYHLFCCTNIRPEDHPRGSCGRMGGAGLRDYMKQRVKEEDLPSVRVNTAGCLDRCELGPVVVVYPEGVWYSLTSEADVDTVIEEHLKNGRPVTRLMLPEAG